MLLPGRDLARLLRGAGHETAAAAADNAGPEVKLSEADRGELLRAHRARQKIQDTAGRAEAALQIGRVVESLERHEGDRILVCRVADGHHHYVVFLTGSADAVVGVLIPPRRPDEPAKPSVH